MKYLFLALMIISIGLAYFFIDTRKSNESFRKDLVQANSYIKRLQADTAARGYMERKRIDSIKVLAKQKESYFNRALKAESKARAYYLTSEAFNKSPINITGAGITTAEAKSVLFELEQSNKFKDSAYSEMDTANTDLKKSLVKCNQENAQKDSLISELQADKKDLSKIDSVHVDLLNKSIDNGRKKFWKGLGIGGAAGVVITLLILL